MADTNFPQLPRRVWIGVWDILRKAPKRKLDEKALAAELSVQQTAARQYVRELIKLGLLGEDSAPTDLANRWRQDGQAPDVINEMLERAYPTNLRELAPPDSLDRDKIIRWFMNEGLGEGSAKNRAATYIMVACGVDNEAVSAAAPKAPSRRPNERRSITIPAEPRTVAKDPRPSRRTPHLAVNVQIHISADASAEQIDAIFAAMRTYFEDE